MKSKIQNYPAADSPSTDALEGLVETYYQLQGFITSSSKWFWAQENGKSKRGYQDIDVLAVSASETLIISVTSDLSDKISLNSKHQAESLRRLNGFFERSSQFLSQVEQYRWMVVSPREVRYLLVYGHAEALANKSRELLLQNQITLISIVDILSWLRNEVEKRYQREGLRTNNQPLKLLQLMIKKRTFTHS